MARVARSDGPPRDSIAGDALLRRVIAAVDGQSSLAAKLRYQVNLQGRTAGGVGRLLAAGQGTRAADCVMELTLRHAADHQPGVAS